MSEKKDMVYVAQFNARACSYSVRYEKCRVNILRYDILPMTNYSKELAIAL